MRAMKDSGIEWIGEIPVSWKIPKVKYLFGSIGSGSTPNTNRADYYNGDINWIQSSDINGNKIKETAKKITIKAVNEISSIKIYKKPFVVIAMYGASIGNISISEIDACTNQACCVLSNPNINEKLIYHYIKNSKSQIVKLAVGGTQPNVSMVLIKNLHVPISNSIKEQSIIVNYLDGLVEKIDNCIEKQQEVIIQLSNFKRSLITEAVTKGLDPNTPMKDSGIEWIGEIPEHWRIVKIKNLFFEIEDRNDGTLSPNDLLSVSEYYGVAPKIEKIDEGDFVTRAKTVDHYKVCKKGDLVINIMLAWKKGLGVSDYQGLVSPSYCVYRRKSNDVNPKFYHYLFRTGGCADEFKRHSTGIIDSRLRLYSDEFFSLFTLMPPPHEQFQISNFLDCRVSRIEDIIRKKEYIIDRLYSFKNSIVYEAVTGKIEVCHVPY